MAAAAAIAQFIGTGLQIYGTLASGAQAERMGEIEQAQLNEQAIQTEAVAQRTAISERDQGDLAKSRAKAVSAASGLSASDEGSQAIYNEIDAQSEYNAMAALYSGYDQAKKMRREGVMAKFEGKQAKKASYINAGATLLQGGASMYNNYGKS